MKTFLSIFFTLIISIALQGQVGVGTTNPNSSAALDVVSTTQGFLPPRMTGAQREAIGSPTAGLFIWCTDCGIFGAAQLFNGLFWTTLPSPVFGQSFQGGVIAYVLQPGDPGYDPNVPHGLITPPTNQSTGLPWYNETYTITGATGTAIGTGQANTTAIVASQGAGSYAAQVCNELVLNGYSDWYLPSQDELNKLYTNRVAIGGFANANYWSSSEVDLFNALFQNFSNGVQGNTNKIDYFYVRAVRAF